MLADYLTPSSGGESGRFIVIVGIDGSGKSSVISGLDIPTLATAEWRDLCNHELPAMLAPDAPTRIKNRLPQLARAMFIGGHIVAQYEYLVRPRLDTGTSVLLDSYFYKLLAKETLLGRLHGSFVELCSQLPMPDCVIFLDVDPTESYERKRGRLSPYEYFSNPTRDDFVDFQNQLRGLILSQLRVHPDFHRIDGNGDRAEVLSRVSGELAKHVACQPVEALP